MNKIIPAFRDSILEASDFLGEWIELGIDSILENDVLKGIPIVGTLSGFCKVGYSVHERNLLRQTLAFINGLNAKTIAEEKVSAYKEKMSNDAKTAEKELGRVIFILNSHIETQPRNSSESQDCSASDEGAGPGLPCQDEEIQVLQG